MPLELKPRANSEACEASFDNYADLRVTLIGNNDLKYKLIGDTKFMEKLVHEFSTVINTAVSDPNYFFSNNVDEFLNDLEHKIVVVKILSSFITEVSSNNNRDISTSLNEFEGLIQPMISFVSYFIEKFSPLIYGRTLDDNLVHTLEIMVEYCLDIFVALFNNKNYGTLFQNDGTNKLWRFITSLLIITYDSSDISELILTKLLKLVPVLLNNASSNASIHEPLVTLLSTLLKRLSKECKTLNLSNFPAIEFTPEIVSRLAFEDPNLPNLELNPYIFRTKVNLLLLTDLITCTAQIFSFLNDNKYGIFINPSLDVGKESPDNALLLSDIYLTMLLLIKYENKALNLAALNLVYLHLNNLKQFSNQDDSDTRDELIFSNFKKVTPKLIELLSLDDNKFVKPTTLPIFLLSPTKILTNLSSQYPSISDELRKNNVDYKIMKSLELQFKSSQKIKYFKLLKHNSQNCTKLVDFTVMMNSLQETNLNSLTDLLLLLSVFTSKKEEYRERVVNYKLSDTKSKHQHTFSQMVFELIDDYRFVLIQVQLVHRILYPKDNTKKVSGQDIAWLSKNLGIMITLVNDPAYTNVLYLIRSLSRSVALLRTFFVDCNSIVSEIDIENSVDIARSRYARDRNSSSGGFISNILQILKGNEISSKLIQFFCNFNSEDYTGRQLNKSQMLNKSITLGTIANFVLDFSSFRYNIVNDEGFLKNLSVIYKNSLVANYKTSTGKTNDEEMFQKNTIQLSILQILKNYMYNENQENKKELIEYFPISILFDKIVYGVAKSDNIHGHDVGGESEEIKGLRLQQKIVAFDILRNLTAGSPYFSQYLIDAYDNKLDDDVKKEDKLPMSWADFVIANITNFENFERNHERVNLNKELFRDDSFLLSLMDNNDYVSLVLAINYIEDHKFTNIEQFRERLLPKESLLKVWKRFLNLTVTEEFESQLDLNSKININNNLNSIKLSIVWIIINLTWKNDVFEYTFPGADNDTRRSSGDNYRIYDTVESSPNRRTSSANDRIDIDNSDDSDNEKKEMSDDNEISSNPNNHSDATSNLTVGESDEKITTPTERAKILKQYGFLEVLDNLIGQLGNYEKSNRNNLEKGYTGQRFDYFMSNDLLEKIKTARYQIFSLESGGHISFRPRQSRTSQQLDRNTTQQRAMPTTTSNSDAVTAAVLAAAGAGSGVSAVPRLVSRPDVNRGGEGYGYGSDNDFTEVSPIAPIESHANDDEDMENDDDDDDDDSVDEDWIH